MKNTIKFILFFLISLFIFFCFESVFQTDNLESNWRKFENLERDSVDLVIFGNSHAVNTYHQFLLNDLLSINTLVIGEGGVTFPLFYFELLRVLETQSPKYVIVETFLFDTSIRENRYINYLRAAKLKVFDVELILQFLEPDNFWWISEFAMNHANIYKEPDIVIKNSSIVFSEVGNEENLTWYYNLDAVITESKNSDSYLLKRAEVDEETHGKYLKYLYKFKELCDKNNIQMIFVRSPMQAIDLEEPISYVNEFSKTNEILMDNIDEKLHLSQIDFFSENHVSTLGSYKASLELSEFLANETNLNLNENVYKEYSNLLFYDFNYSKSKDYLFFELIRENKDYTNLNFSWEIVGENTTIEFITFTPIIEIKNQNVESLFLKIYSDEINYPLTLKFNFPLR